MVPLILAFCSNCLTFIFIKNLTLLDHPKHPLAVKIYSLVKINEKKIIKNLLGNSFPFCLTLFHLIVSNVRSFLQMISMKKGRNYFLKFVIMISIFFFCCTNNKYKISMMICMQCKKLKCHHSNTLKIIHLSPFMSAN